MAGTPIPWPVSARPHDSYGGTGESQGDLLNVYAMKSGEVVQWRRVPGLKRFTGTTGDPSSRIPRGTLEVDNYIVTAWAGGLEAVTATAAVIPMNGAVAGTTPVTMARNMRTIPQIAIVADGGAYLGNLDTMTVSPYPLTDVSPAKDGSQLVNNLGFVNSVDYYAGYFIFSRPDGTIVASDLQNAEIPDLSYDKAEQAADGLLRIVNNGETVLAMGHKTIEVWQDVGKSPFPLARATVIPVGLLGQFAVAGGPQVWERGLLFVASDFTVRQLEGYSPQIVSTDSVSRDLYLARFTPERLRAQVYVFNSHAIFSLSHDNWTWEYNLTTGSWHRRQSLGHSRWRALFANSFANRWLVQDELHDGLLEIDAAVYHEDGTRLLAQLTSGALKDYPVSVRIPAIFFDFEVGLGRSEAPGREGYDPVAMLSWSHDGGATWSNPLARSLGRQGQRSALMTLRNIGRSSHRGTMLRWEITDPVDITFRQAVAPVLHASRPRQVKG
jgi:hypothetical protein